MIPLSAFYVNGNCLANAGYKPMLSKTIDLNINLTTKAQKSNERPQGEPSKYR